jgi:hypothetical protein
MAVLFFPSLNVFWRNIGNHVHVTAGAASTTGNISILFHCSFWVSSPVLIKFSANAGYLSRGIYTGVS